MAAQSDRKFAERTFVGRDSRREPVLLRSASKHALRVQDFFMYLIGGDSVSRACKRAGLYCEQISEIIFADSVKLAEIKQMERQSGGKQVWRSQLRERAQEILQSDDRVLALANKTIEAAENMSDEDAKAKAKQMMEATKVSLILAAARAKKDPAGEAAKLARTAMKKKIDSDAHRAIDKGGKMPYTESSLKITH